MAGCVASAAVPAHATPPTAPPAAVEPLHRDGPRPAPRPASARPRVCLVLSGGGARGMAHIGVLRVIEELKVPVDCIAGTSMGAVVGGLYASGMSAAQIETTMRSVNWQEAFRDAPPRRDLNFRRKQDDRNFLVRLPLGLKHYHILLPKGFIQGQTLQETLRQLTLPFSNTTNFDELPTPFRAVATDLVTGDAVLLEKGDLSIAMRASISAPGVFAPVDYRGPAPGRRRRRGESPHRCGASHARGHAHRVGRELPAAAARYSSIRRYPFPTRCSPSWCARTRIVRRPPWVPGTFSSSRRWEPRRPPTSRLPQARSFKGSRRRAASSRGSRSSR